MPRATINSLNYSNDAWSLLDTKEQAHTTDLIDVNMYVFVCVCVDIVYARGDFVDQLRKNARIERHQVEYANSGIMA